MSLRDISLFHVLGEDDAHRSFIRAWLKTNGVADRCIHTVTPPADKSGGWSFVLARCQETVTAARLRDRSKAKTRVVVALDADEGTVEDRISQVKQTIAGAAEEGTLDLLCILVPKRHIETWVHALGPAEAQVNEQEDYKHKSTEEIRAAARRLARLLTAPTQPSSLVHGYSELQRLKDS